MTTSELRSAVDETTLNQRVRSYWEAEPCGTEAEIVGGLTPYSKEWFEQIEAYRYAAEPFIHSIAQFTRYHGQKLLEVGVGAGTDHLQWARAGARCHGIDLTAAGIATTRAHLELYGLQSQLQEVDAEAIPFGDEYFDIVYSWGVIHHSEHPERVLGEIRRVLKPGGHFIGMMYNRHSLAVYKYWLKYALLRGRPNRSLAEVIWHHVESIGTKAYTVAELEVLFAAFSVCKTTPLLTRSDYGRLPRWLYELIPSRFGWYIALQAVK